MIRTFKTLKIIDLGLNNFVPAQFFLFSLCYPTCSYEGF